ncbi:hypothetical protein ACWEN6_19185 [Sphaerisporangium sp. NPDC004334]
MGLINFSRYEWIPTSQGDHKVTLCEKIDLTVSLARVVLTNGLASINGNIYGSYDSLRLESQLLATMLAYGHKRGTGPLHRVKAFDCSSLHIQSFTITSAGLGLLTASIESLLIQGRLNSYQIDHFDLMPATTRQGSGANTRPDLLINLPSGRLMIGEAKGRRRGSAKITKDKLNALTRLHRWSSGSLHQGSPLLLSWASILTNRTTVEFFHTPPDEEVEPLIEEQDRNEDHYARDLYYPSEEFYNVGESASSRPTSQATRGDEIDPDIWDDIAEHLTEPLPSDLIEDVLFLSAPEPPVEYPVFADVPIRGTWSSLNANSTDNRSIFVGILREELSETYASRVRERGAGYFANNRVPPLDIATQGRIVCAIAQNPEVATWRALQRSVD